MQEQSVRLGTDDIKKLLISLSTPAMVGMLVTGIYNIVDAIFIGKGVGTLGLAGVSVAFPMQMILMALAGAVGIGGGSIISRRLGASRLKEANQVLGNVIILVIIIGVINAVCGILFINPILRLFGATAAILPYARDFLSIILLGSVFYGLAMSFNNIARAEGNARMAMWTMIFSAVINTALAPLFIFGFRWGLKGAALATIIAQACAASYMVAYFIRGNSTLRISWDYMRLNPSIIKEIIYVGSSAFGRQAADSIMFIVVNNVLAFYGGDLSIAVFGVINRVLMITIMPILGIVQGMQPIVGYNYGADDWERVKSVLLLAVKYASILAVMAFILVMIFPECIIRIFSSDTLLINQGSAALRAIFAAVFLIGVQMVLAGFYQALGKAKQALILGMARQILFLIPLVLALSHIWGVKGVWAAFPSADICAFIFTLLIFYNDAGKKWVYERAE
ncbi:MATE family efflux transporter [Thermosyntropha sp.]|uniref:MATE family efflux transporter n=1 Tax=Thermosyntropha sp. TaxID=2740820 RepID=UPI0025E085DB|nr:MATE family efflux transporter [Thermosyntropha sp.]MBO8159911.1 MATE family efflux transporter [Thermosyntropha sp.]